MEGLTVFTMGIPEFILLQFGSLVSMYTGILKSTRQNR